MLVMKFDGRNSVHGGVPCIVDDRQLSFHVTVSPTNIFWIWCQARHLIMPIPHTINKCSPPWIDDDIRTIWVCQVPGTCIKIANPQHMMRRSMHCSKLPYPDLNLLQGCPIIITSRWGELWCCWWSIKINNNEKFILTFYNCCYWKLSFMRFSNF